MNRILRSLKQLMVLVASVASVVLPVFGADPACQKIGINLTGTAYYGTEMAFTNLLSQSEGWRRPWGSPNKALPIEVDQSGNPLSVSPDNNLINLIHSDKWDRPANETLYRLTWDGTGAVAPGTRSKIIKSGANEVIFEMAIKPGANFWLNMTSTSKTDPVRNVSMVPITAMNSTDYAPLETGKFRQRYKDSLGHFQILRFMDWNDTNNSTIKEWSERRKAGDVRYLDGKGISYENMIDLANESGKDIWVNVPVSASDDYVAKMAKLFSNKLKADRTVYVEFTNEAWNAQFKQFGVINGWATQLGIKQLEAYADRALRVFDIWRNNFARSQNLKVILAGQLNNAWVAQKALAYKDAGHKVDGIAIAAYVGWRPAEYIAMTDWLNTATPDMLIARIKSEAMPAFRKQLEAHAALAKAYGIPLVAYEGGQHLAGPTNLMRENVAITNLFISTNRSPGMADIFSSIMYEWSRVGGGPFVFFTQVGEYSKWGSWGLREHGAQTLADSPKLKGIYQYCGWTQ